MTHHTRPARAPFMLGLAASALLHACAITPRPCAAQTPAPPAQVARDPSAYLGPISKEWLLYALRAQEADEAALVRLLERRGIDSYPSAEDERELRAAGASDRLLEAVRKHVATPPPMVGGFGPGRGIGPGEPVPPGGGGPGRNSEPVDYTRPFQRREVMKRAVIIFRPEPDLTEKARRKGVSGVVRLRAVLNFSGEVTNISVIKGLPDGLTDQAVAAARRIKFTPAEKDGRKVSQYVVLEYLFGVIPGEQAVAAAAAERAAVVEKTFDPSEVDERAIILATPQPEYTEEARRNNVRGKVRLKVRLMRSGYVVVDSVEAELPYGLTGKAAEAAERIKFEPARLGGRHVTQRATVEYVFNP